MIPIDAFPYELNQLFSEYQAASSIVILYRMKAENKSLPRETDLQVTGVNGFGSVTFFSQYLSGLEAGLLDRLKETLAKIEVNARPLFLKQAIYRCNRLLRTCAQVVAEPHANDQSAQPMALLWHFRHATFLNDQGQPGDEALRKKLLQRTSRYAHQWQHHVTDLKEQLGYLVCLTNYLPMVSVEESEPARRVTITVRCTVEELAVFGKMLYNDHAFVQMNRAQFCRLIANFFSTTRQAKISEHSFRNHFDNPSADVVERICAKLGRMMKNSRKLNREK